MQQLAAYLERTIRIGALAALAEKLTADLGLKVPALLD
jgi:hypothetical protein